MQERSDVNLVDPYALIRAVSALSVFFLHASVFASLYGFSFDESDWILCTAAHSAVWVFIFLAGLFNIGGFLGDAPRYKLTKDGILGFYAKRFKSVIVPVWFFELIALVVSEPDFIKEHPEVTWKLLTFTYTGEPGCSSIAATWYVSTIFWLYLITPLIAWILIRIKAFTEGRKAYVLILILTAAGLLYRYLMYRAGADWTQRIFVPFYSNLDLFISGGVASLIRSSGKKESKGWYAAALLFFAAVCVAANRFYFMKAYDEKYLTWYRYAGASAVCIIMSIMVLMISMASLSYGRADRNAIRKNPFRIIDLFAGVSFEFYLVHSMVLFHISPLIHASSTKGYYGKLLLAGGVFSVTAACLFKAVTKGYNGFIFRRQKGKNSG